MNAPEITTTYFSSLVFFFFFAEKSTYFHLLEEEEDRSKVSYGGLSSAALQLAALLDSSLDVRLDAGPMAQPVPPASHELTPMLRVDGGFGGGVRSSCCRSAVANSCSAANSRIHPNLTSAYPGVCCIVQSASLLLFNIRISSSF